MLTAAEEPLEPDEQETPQGPVSVRYPNRRYAGDRPFPQRLRQWFIPLPNRPTLAPLTRDELLDKESEIRLEATDQLLEEAMTVWEARQERIQSAESKATTLLGTVAIAASVVVAGSGLILDPARVADGWREALMVVLALLLICLLMCGAMASRALLKVHKVSRPQVRQALQRARGDPREGARRRAVDLLARAGENLYIADYKLAQVRVAYRWYRLSLLFFLVLGLLIAGYVLSGDLPEAAE